MNKKGTELSMNVIIIAAIALIILVVIVMLVMNSFKDVSDANSCETMKSGQCLSLMDGESCSSYDPGLIRYFKDCPIEGDICCAAKDQS